MTKVVVLAGGQGMRMGGKTDVPKPLTPIGGKAMIDHVINSFQAGGFSQFLILLGFGAASVSDHICKVEYGSQVETLDTGVSKASAGRLHKARSAIGNAPFILAYCDCLHDADLAAFSRIHEQSGCSVTMLTVNPVLPFGVVDKDGDRITAMHEKPRATDMTINAGLFMVEPEALDLIDNETTSWERDVLPRLAIEGRLAGYHHNGFWQSMDTPKDAHLLTGLMENGNPPWLPLGKDASR